MIFRANACAAGGPICCACSALVILLGSAFQSSNSNKGPRKFYLTRTTHTGAEALSACAGGYYMASMWEIHDPSNLRYDTELGFTRGDSGFGPPSQSPGGFSGENAYGWIRTGWEASTVSLPGAGNCDAWTRADISGDVNGTVVSLNNRWDSSGVRVIGPWNSLVRSRKRFVE